MPIEPLDVEARLLIEAILARYHYDFRQYAFVSVKRRLANALTRFGLSSISELQGKVLRDPALFSQLLDFLTVQVSEMFRDPSYFNALRTEVLPVLATYPSFKVWVAGCSTGEEAYSIAILLREAGLLSRALIYATDINDRALDQARQGVYSASRMASFAENFERCGATVPLSNYYTQAYGNAVLDKTLRKQIVFADHSLSTDSVFAEVHLVSCRNVLIYFDRSLQDRAVGLFADALAPRGFLGIGSRESLRFSQHAGRFDEISREERLFQKKGA